jgi:hypothetical protein
MSAVSFENVQRTIEDRQSRHGDYGNTSSVAQELKMVMRASKRWAYLKPSRKESLELIATKLARILSGNPEDLDHWHDIEGYAHLISEDIKEMMK